MKLSLIQMDIVWEDKSSNMKKATSFIEKAAGENSDLIIFPEMFSTGFSMSVEKIAELHDGPTSHKLSAMARKYNLNIIAGCAEIATKGKAENVAAAFNRDGLQAARYSKCHPFSFAGEDKYYIPGNGPVMFEIDGIPSSMFICYDLRFPEIFRKVAKSVSLMIVIANWPSTRKDHWEALLKARAIENQCFIVGVNRTGQDTKGLAYDGGSCVFGPSGTLHCKGNAQQEYLTADIDLAEVTETRNRLPFLKDMVYI